jgi:mycobactin peptide synthetase MbtE
VITQTDLIKSLEGNGGKIAVEQNGMQFSYGDLLAGADKITHYLLSKQVESQSVIGIRSKSVAEIISCMIGIMNARCVFVIIDDSMPAQRIGAVIDEIKPACIITADGSPELSVLSAVQQYSINSIFQTNIAGNTGYPAFEEDDSVYIYFTSGSTGKPKGIVGKNSSLAQFLRWEISNFNISSNDRFSQFISPFFDAFLRDIFVPLCAGATICVPSRTDDFFTPQKMKTWIDENRISVIHCVPSLFRVFNSGGLTAENFNDLRYVLLSGEKINPQELKPWYNVFDSRIQLVNLYGATETTMIRCWYPITPKDVNRVKMPIGKPIDGTEILIADKDFKPCNVLVTGEIFIVSAYMTKGYLNNPELNAARFVTFTDTNGNQKMAFRSGDNARRLMDGSIELLGREDRMIKISGIRVELDEIEQVILQSGLVENTVVTTTAGNEETVVAFVVKKAGAAAANDMIDKLNTHITAFLPKYMMPSAIYEVESFPLLSNGKINLKALQGFKPAKAVVPPADATEERLLGLWKDLFGDKPISVEDTFHSIGGNSLMMMKLISKIYTEFNVRVSLAGLFKNLTIRSQANLVGRLKIDKAGVYVVGKAAEKDFYPLSSSQATIYYNYEMNRMSTAYNMPMVMEITEEVDADKIENVFRELIRRHESLRTTFVYNNDSVVQCVNETAQFNLEQVNVASEKLEKAILDFPQPFDLSRAPLIRAGIVKAGDKAYLLADLHHIICDGLSQQVLFKEFIQLYDGKFLQPAHLQYRDYAEWEQHFRTQEDFIRQREFWLRSFEAEIPRLSLFSAGKKGRSISDEGSNFDFVIDESTSKSFINGLRSRNITTFSGLFAALQILLYRLTGQEDMVIGMLAAGRTQEELESMVGVFVKVLPVRYSITTGKPFAEYAANVQKHLSEANSNQLYNLIDLMSDINKDKHNKTGRLFDVLFNYQASGNIETPVQKLPFVFCNVNEDTANYPLEVKVFDDEEGLKIRFVYSLGYFNDEQVDAFATRFNNLIQDIAVDMDAEITDASGEEDESLLEEEVVFNFG